MMPEPLTLWHLLAALVTGLLLAGWAAWMWHRRFRRRQHFDLTAICRRCFDNGWLSAGGDPARVYPENRPPPIDLPDDYAAAMAHGRNLPWSSRNVSANNVRNFAP